MAGVRRYVFTVYALSEAPELKAGFKLSQMHKLLEGKVLDEAMVTGTYAR